MVGGGQSPPGGSSGFVKMQIIHSVHLLNSSFSVLVGSNLAQCCKAEKTFDGKKKKVGANGDGRRLGAVNTRCTDVCHRAVHPKPA